MINETISISQICLLIQYSTLCSIILKIAQITQIISIMQKVYARNYLLVKATNLDSESFLQKFCKNCLDVVRGLLPPMLSF